MANISSVKGYMLLEGVWTVSMVEKLNKVAEVWRKWYYNIDITEDFSINKDEMIPFIANGRWSFMCNLEHLYDWTCSDNEEFSDTFVALLREMHENEATIYIEYQETDCGILQEAGVTLEANSNNMLVVNESWIEHYDYNAENLVELNFYEDWGDICESCTYYLENNDKDSLEFGKEFFGEHFYKLVEYCLEREYVTPEQLLEMGVNDRIQEPIESEKGL